MPPSGTGLKRLIREITELGKNPPEGIRIQTNEEDMLDVTGIIEGPEGTPYAGGYFRVRFKFTEEFPAAPPKCWFSTKLFHPNVGPTGEICVNTLKKDWKSTYGIGHILVTVKCLLIYPNPESALDEEAGKMLMEDYESYCERAKLITSVHATPRVRPVEFETPSKVEEEDGKAGPSTGAVSASASAAPIVKAAAAAAASTSLSTPPTASSSTLSVTVTPPVSTSSSTSWSSKLGIPSTTSRKASPTPLKSSLSTEKEGGLKHQERHTSPAPLSTADANVEGSKIKMGFVGTGLGRGMAPGAGGMGGGVGGNGGGGSKAMKRAATNSAVSGAEKRKKALKRL